MFSNIFFLISRFEKLITNLGLYRHLKGFRFSSHILWKCCTCWQRWEVPCKRHILQASWLKALSHVLSKVTVGHVLSRRWIYPQQNSQTGNPSETHSKISILIFLLNLNMRNSILWNCESCYKIQKHKLSNFIFLVF